jgi:hypothetical protein
MAWVCLYLTPWAKRGKGDKGKCAHEWQGSCLDLGRNAYNLLNKDRQCHLLLHKVPELLG